MIIKIIANSLFIIALAVTQISFISGLPGPFNYLNLALVILIFILGFAGFNLAVWWSFGVGIILEIFFFLPFGTYLASLIVTVIIANFLLNYFFTNYSSFTFLALVALSTIIYEIAINLITWVFMAVDKYFFLADINFLTAVLKQSGLNLLLTVFIYYSIHFFARSLGPVFLIHPVKSR